MQHDDLDEQFPYTTIGTDEAHRMYEEGVRIIDVRTPQEWNQAHVPNTTRVTIEGIYSFGAALQAENLPLDEPVLFLCAAGQRSATASEIALLLGFKKVYNIANGIQGWYQRGYPIER